MSKPTSLEIGRLIEEAGFQVQEHKEFEGGYEIAVTCNHETGQADYIFLSLDDNQYLVWHDFTHSTLFGTLKQRDELTKNIRECFMLTGQPLQDWIKAHPAPQGTKNIVAAKAQRAPSEDFLPDPKPALVRAPRKRGQAKELKVLGRRDPRGPDNSVYIWVDENDQLHIRVLKTNRCYKFKQVIETNGYVEVVAN